MAHNPFFIEDDDALRYRECAHTCPVFNLFLGSFLKLLQGEKREIELDATNDWMVDVTAGRVLVHNHQNLQLALLNRLSLHNRANDEGGTVAFVPFKALNGLVSRVETIREHWGFRLQ